MSSFPPVASEPVLAGVWLDSGARATLNPKAPAATGLSEVFAQVADHVGPLASKLADTLKLGLVQLFQAQLQNFPENLFWDFDYLAVATVREALGQAEPAAHLQRSFTRMADLQQLFGQGTPIRFRYVHDFIYGYDWAKWVRRAPDSRAGVGPFDWEFLTYMYRRGHELLALIEADDQKYPRLRSDAPRNPFGFSREPPAERAIHADLARRGQIPVAAWDPGAEPEWDHDYAQIRSDRAHALGYGR